MLMSIHSFAKWLNKCVPQPFFLQKDMVDIVIRLARERLGVKTTLSLVEMSRTDRGGIRILVKKEVKEKEASVQEKGRKKKEKQWELEADEWGRFLSMK
jgi:hypothetical protein